ncbi:MAG: RES family NAD+ phosphorylase [Hyphomicrobiales bacterium]|nr:RES family NAD+ phosphorylase [Hyphomicrobiales bacterium]
MKSSTSHLLSRTFEPKTFRLAYEKSPVFFSSVNDNDSAIRKLLKKYIGEDSELLEPDAHEELAYGNARIIHKTFTLSRQGNGRFSDGKQGAWYCARDCDTAIDEAAYQQMRRMDRSNGKKSGVYTDEVIFKELFAKITGKFYHTALPRDKDVLGTEPKKAYPLGQELAHKIVRAGGQGIIYSSVRRSGGVCLAVFDPESIQNVEVAARWKISWNGSRRYTPERID